MVDCLGFKDVEHALKVRNEYFGRYHATAKGLTIARQEGVFTAPYQPQDFDNYITANLNYKLLGGKKVQLIKDLHELSNINIVAFSNAPKQYAKRVLQELGLYELFGEERIYAVDDVLPACKPEPEAFEKIFKALGGVRPEQCIMVEDSMKNVRCAKQLGSKTVLVVGAGKLLSSSSDSDQQQSDRYDAPSANDDSVDVAIETIGDFRSTLPGLWESPPQFIVPPPTKPAKAAAPQPLPN